MSVSRSTRQRVAERRAQQRRRARTISIALVGVLAVVVAGIIILASWRSAEERQLLAEVSQELPSVGSTDAPVLIEEFSDFACSYCADFSQTLHQLIEAYTVDGTLRVVHVPITSLHPPYSETAAEAAVCAGEQGSYWEMYDALFALYRAEGATAYTAERMLEMGDSLGLDRASFETCLNAPETASFLARAAEIASARGVTSTPVIFVNGERVPATLEARSFDSLSQWIESLR
jgi:protein-disulfide isomerase